ncbi:hypothetical protein GOQ30_04230 [Flavobacterium sp. TP390]|uniref:Uncharacterized protein n=1 Tax=Flavobacterium profundi TaxID=1774945 RepID=A0A6I4IK40_9FLAO|nr:hypothetical protein [Flavobacterium profundi]MVO08371.1 hypothetical protein [Flavobacterium profundi]
MEIAEFEKNLTLSTDYLNSTIELNDKIKSYEALGIKTPTIIQETLIDINISANLVYVYTDCIAIGKSFNTSNLFLYQLFFIKSIIRTVHEGFRIIKKYETRFFIEDLENDKVKEVTNLRKVFKKKFNLEIIQENRNKIGSHYPEDFMEHYNTIKNIDVKLTLEMFFAFLLIITKINDYLIFERFSHAKLNQVFAPYFKDVEEKLTILGNQENS